MTDYDLLALVEKAKTDDREAMAQIIQMFDPSIKKMCSKSHPNERNDLRQHLTEKIINAVLNYDLSIVPNHTDIIKHLFNEKE